jgi:long-chain acyl-CoA synthetase
MSASAADDVFDWAASDPGRAMFSREADGRWLPVTAGEFAGRVAAVAAGLIAAGIRAGDRVGLMSPASLDWAVFLRHLGGRGLRAAVGGEVAWAASGGAPLADRLGHFFRGAGITILEGWGLTETAGPVTFNLPGAQRIGSVGLPLPGCAVRTAPDGEILVAGPGVFQGHWGDLEATRDAFDGPWFRTGDLGRIDDDGFVYLTGRKKDLIITANGQNVAPAILEDAVREHWLVDECVLTGDQRPYIGALVTLDPGAFARWKQRRGKPASATVGDLCGDQDLQSVVQDAVDRANSAVSRAGSIKRFRILPAAFAVGAELTPTRKVRRDYVLATYASDIDALYA